MSWDWKPEGVVDERSRAYMRVTRMCRLELESMRVTFVVVVVVTECICSAGRSLHYERCVDDAINCARGFLWFCLNEGSFSLCR